MSIFSFLIRISSATPDRVVFIQFQQIALTMFSGLPTTTLPTKLTAEVVSRNWEKFKRVGEFTLKRIFQKWSESNFEAILDINEEENKFTIDGVDCGQLFWPHENRNDEDWYQTDKAQELTRLALPMAINFLCTTATFKLGLLHLARREHPLKESDVYARRVIDGHMLYNNMRDFTWPISSSVPEEDRYAASLQGKIMATRQAELNEKLRNTTFAVALEYRGPSGEPTQWRIDGPKWGDRINPYGHPPPHNFGGQFLYDQGFLALRNFFMGTHYTTVWRCEWRADALPENYSLIGSDWDSERTQVEDRWNRSVSLELEELTDLRMAMEGQWPFGPQTRQGRESQSFLMVYVGPTSIQGKGWETVYAELRARGLPEEVAKRISVKGRRAIMRFSAIPYPVVGKIDLVNTLRSRFGWRLGLYGQVIPVMLSPLTTLGPDPVSNPHTRNEAATSPSENLRRHDAGTLEVSPGYMAVTKPGCSDITPTVPVTGESVNGPRFMTRKSYPVENFSKWGRQDTDQMWTGRVKWQRRSWYYESMYNNGAVSFIPQTTITQYRNSRNYSRSTIEINVKGRVNRVNEPTAITELIGL